LERQKKKGFEYRTNYCTVIFRGGIGKTKTGEGGKRGEKKKERGNGRAFRAREALSTKRKVLKKEIMKREKG